jgi:hypothetical protein
VKINFFLFCALLQVDLLTTINSTQLDQAASSLLQIQHSYKVLLDKLQALDTSPSLSMQSLLPLVGQFVAYAGVVLPALRARELGMEMAALNSSVIVNTLAQVESRCWCYTPLYYFIDFC